MVRARSLRFRGMSIARGLKLTLVAQAIVAVFLLIAEIEARWLPTPVPPDAPKAPVGPGDQVRRYDPKRVAPYLADPIMAPVIEMPEAFPPRLSFSLHEADGFGSFLLLAGTIDDGDAVRLGTFLASLGESPSAVALNSPGGLVGEALAIGRLVRGMKLDTVVFPGMVCLSSCPYILAGGVERRVSRRGAVGLHQHYYDTPGYLPVYFAVEGIQRSQGLTMEHLIEMGVDSGVMAHGLATPPTGIYVLLPGELLGSRLATEVIE